MDLILPKENLCPYGGTEQVMTIRALFRSWKNYNQE